MSTRSYIALQTKEGEDNYRVIYAHWDGYPEWRMPLLTEHYKSGRKAQKLIDLGSVSSLGEKLPFEVDMSTIKPNGLNWEDEGRTLDEDGNPVVNTLTTYHAMNDMEDGEVNIMENMTLKEIISNASIFIEWLYIGQVFGNVDDDIVEWSCISMELQRSMMDLVNPKLKKTAFIVKHPQGQYMIMDYMERGMLDWRRFKTKGEAIQAAAASGLFDYAKTENSKTFKSLKKYKKN